MTRAQQIKEKCGYDLNAIFDYVDSMTAHWEIEEDDYVEIDQDWDNETTTIEFNDGSMVVIIDSDVEYRYGKTRNSKQ